MRKINVKNKTSKRKKYKGGSTRPPISYNELKQIKELFEKITHIDSKDKFQEIVDLLEKGTLKETILEIISIIETILVNKNKPDNAPKINIALEELSQHVQNLASGTYKTRGARVGAIIGAATGHGAQVVGVGIGKGAVTAGKGVVTAGKAIRSGIRNIFRRGTAKSGNGASASNDIDVPRGADGELGNPIASPTKGKLNNRLNNMTKNKKVRAAREANNAKSSKIITAPTGSPVPPANAAAPNDGASVKGNVDLAVAVPAAVAANANANAGGNVAVVPPPAPNDVIKGNVAVVPPPAPNDVIKGNVASRGNVELIIPPAVVSATAPPNALPPAPPSKTFFPGRRPYPPASRPYPPASRPTPVPRKKEKYREIREITHNMDSRNNVTGAPSEAAATAAGSGSGNPRPRDARSYGFLGRRRNTDPHRIPPSGPVKVNKPPVSNTTLARTVKNRKDADPLRNNSLNGSRI